MSNLNTLDVQLGYWINMTSARAFTYPAAAQTATPVPTATPLLALPSTPTPQPTPTPTATLAPRTQPVYPPATITANTTWRAADGVYVVNATVTVNQGVVLTIEPGTVVKFSGTGLIVNGALIAEGTSAAPIIFTSLLDDSYGGDTNNDGSASTPAAGNWGAVYFSPSSVSSRLRYARLLYGGGWNSNDPPTQPAILLVNGGSPTVQNVTVEQGTSYGMLFINSASPTVRNSRIAHIAGIGVSIKSSAMPTLENNIIEGNQGHAIFMEANTAPRFSGNRTISNGTNGVGVNGTIAPSVTWDSDLPYVIDGGLTVNPGITLNLQPGAVVKFRDQNQWLTVNGTLRASGAAANPIVFTSLKDDTAGGDTNNDGSATRPASGDWGGITFNSSGGSSLLDYVTVRYGGGQYPNPTVSIDGAALTIGHSQIMYGKGHGLLLSNLAMPFISDSTIRDNDGNGLEMASSSLAILTDNGFINNAGFAIHMDGSCTLSASGSTATNNTYNGIGVSGVIPSDATWEPGLPYIVDGGVTVNSGAVLTILPGVVVKFLGSNMLVNGALQADGAAGNEIVFTSLNDSVASAAGLTLGRLSLDSLEAAPGDWGRIEFASTSSASVLNHVTVRYGGGYYWDSYGSVYLNGSAPSISNTTISHSSGHGLLVSGSSPTLLNNVFAHNANAGVYATTLANPTLRYNLVYSNTQYGVYNASPEVTIDAATNWWGSATGPTYSTNPGGTGDRVSNGVIFTPWLTSLAKPTPTPYPTPTATPAVRYVGGAISASTTWTTANSPYVVNSDVTVNSGVILRIQPGVVVKFQAGTRMTVNGVLAATGNASSPIVFTSDKDDAYGGDTNGDGGATRPSPGAWNGLIFNATASASTLSYALVRYATTGVTMSGASSRLNYSTIMFGSGWAVSTAGGAPAIENNTLRDNTGGGIDLNGSPTIRNNIFVNNGGAAMRMTPSSLPENSGNQAYYNRYNGILVSSGSATVRGTWHRDLPFVIEGDLTIETGVVLTLEPGVVVKLTTAYSYYRGNIIVNGGLVANGTTTDRIIFTSIHDDGAGGDTNNNGSQSWPGPGDWKGIQFTASSLSSSSVAYANIAYGGCQYSYYGGCSEFPMMKITGASPTIANNLVAYSGWYGIQIESLAAPTIRDNIIRDNRNHGLVLANRAAPTVQNNQFIANQGYAVYMDAGCTPVFTGNTATNNRTNGIGVSGTAGTSTTWKANLTYVVEGMTIDSGVTLTLEPGVIVKFGPYASLTANGNLIAVGTSESKIIFTSLKDDTVGGDTNNDGNASAPAAGNWYYMQFTSSSTGSRLEWIEIRYGGYYYCDGCTMYPELLLDGVAMQISNAVVSDSSGYGIQVKNTSPTFTNVEIRNTRYGAYLENAHPTIRNSTIHDNVACGVCGTGSNPTITGSTISNSNWGASLSSTSAPYPNISGNTFANNRGGAASIETPALSTFGLNTFVGTVGNGVWVGSGTLTANATLYGSGVYVLGDVVVEQGATLTVRAGAVVKLRYHSYYYCPYPYYGPCGASLLIHGVLSADGAVDQKIVFTTERDDAYGGDTNADGTATGPAANSWGAIYFAPTAGTSVIDNAIIKYAGSYFYDPYPTGYYGAGVHINNASPTISNSTFENNGSYGLYLNGASPTVTGNTFTGQSYAVYAFSSSFPTITGNTIGSTGTGVYLDDSSHATLSGNTFTANGVAAELKADALPYVGQNTAVSTTGNHVRVRSGAIAANTTLYPSIVYLLGDVVVNSGVVLTAQPGVVVKFAPTYCCWQGGSLLMRGRLAAQGTASQKIVLTADTDDTYGGDTNGDGANSAPAPGRWSGVYLNSSDSNLSYVVMSYGGAYFNVDGTNYGAALILDNVSPSISHSTIARNSGMGIHVINASPNISDNDIWGNGYGVYTQSGARPAIHNNTIRDNTYYGVYNADTGLVVDAKDNSWGHDSGPAPIGAGNGVNYTDTCCDEYGYWMRTYHVAFDPWNGKTHWIEQNLGVLKQWIAYVAEPVNTATGNYTYNYQDLRIPGRGLSLAFDRYYNSQSTYQGPVGHGWTLNYGMNVREEDGNALVMVEDGRVDKYTPDGSGGYTPPKGNYDILTKAGSVFTLKRKDQTRYNFDASGKLASIVDKNGNTVALAYSGGNLATVTDPSGRQLAFSYDGANRITQIAEPAGRTIRFAYDEFSNLISVTDARNNTTHYAYDSKHRILTITDPNGHIFVTNIYDGDGRVITQRDARLNNTTFSYDIYSKVTRVTDPRGSVTTYSYDAELRLQTERDAANQAITYGYDANSNRTSVTDRRGNLTRYAYDAMGNTTIITDALSGVTVMTYDGTNNLTSRTDALGRTTNFTYDAKGNLTRTTDVLGNATAFGYDANGLMTSAADARNNTTTFAYDSHGNQVSITDPLNHTTASTYDLAGRKLTETDALNRTTTYTYDANNNLLTITNAASGVTAYTYDAVGNRLTVTDPLGRVTRYAYDQKDKLISVTDSLSGVTRYEYDANDNKIRETDPLTRTTAFSYDALSRLTQVANPLGYTTRYGYDVDGNRTSVVDANGKTTNFTYDALNRLTRVTDPLLNTTSYVYDAVGNKLRVIDANGNTTEYEYDALNRLVKVTDAMGGVVRYSYDQVGNKTGMTDANAHVTTYVYDALNRLTNVTDPLSNQVQYGYDAVGNRNRTTNARGQATTFAYDTLNRLTGITYPDSSTVVYSHDAVGNRTQMADATGTTTYAYDALNRVTGITNPGSRVVGYTYDAAGNRTGVTYPDGKAVAYTYDAANRLTRVTDWASHQTDYTYDNAGNLTGQANPNNTSASLTYDAANRLTGLIHTSTVSGTVASFSYTLDKVGNRTRMVDAEGATLYEYDKLYRLTAATYPDATNVVYQYDPMGNRLAMTTTHGVTRYAYDAADRLLTAGATAFTWDADGNMLSKGGQAFTYDAANRLTQVVSGTLTMGFAYDGDGRRASKTVNGAVTGYTYDTIAGLAYVLAEQTGSDTTLYTYGADLLAMTDPAGAQSYYHADGLGSTRGLTNGSGQVTARYTYDVFGAVRSSSGTASTAFKFAGEQADDEIGLIYLRARYYDPLAGRFVTQDPRLTGAGKGQELNRYVYAKNNPIGLTDPAGLCAKEGSSPSRLDVAMALQTYSALRNLRFALGRIHTDTLEQTGNETEVYQMLESLELAQEFANPVYNMLAQRLILEMARGRTPFTSLRPYYAGRSWLRNISEIGDVVTFVTNGFDSIERARRGELDSPEVIAGEIFALSSNTINDIITGPARAIAKLLFGQEAVDATPVVAQLDQKITGRQVVDNIRSLMEVGPGRYFGCAWSALRGGTCQ